MLAGPSTVTTEGCAGASTGPDQDRRVREDGRRDRLGRCCRGGRGRNGGGRCPGGGGDDATVAIGAAEGRGTVGSGAAEETAPVSVREAPTTLRDFGLGPSFRISATLL
jgi:hypothetical protein